MEQSEWQDIATAPKDGTRVRLGNEHAPQSMKLKTFGEVTGDYVDGRWRISAFFIIPGHRLHAICDQPTHWMPLPTPPAIKGNRHADT